MEQSKLVMHTSLTQNETHNGRRNKRYIFQPGKRESEVRISIITVTYNSAATLTDTLESVKNQSYKNVEHIIVDGGSTDDTLNIVRSYEHVTTCISEKDSGLYDAMNKGLKKATGNIIGILNSDDVYAHDYVLSHIVAYFENNETETVYGDLNYVNSCNLNKIIRHWRSGNFKRSNFYFGWMPPHPAFFVRKEVYEKVGVFNLALKKAADYELMLRILFRYKLRAAYLPEVLVKMRAGGVSNRSVKNRLEANKEDRLAWKLNDLNPYFFTFYLKPLRKVMQFVFK